MYSKYVSVIIPTYKRPDMLRRAINSVLNQTYQWIEVIVVDDNDKESIYRKETELIMNNYKNNDKVKYIKHENNKNGSAARNTGIRTAKGNFIGFLDNDDEFLPNKIKEQVNILERSSDIIGGVYCSFNVYNDDKIQRSNKYKNEGNLQFDVLCNRLNISGSNILFKKDAIIKTGFYDESFKRHQDLEYLVRFFESYEIKYIDKILLNLNKDDRSNNPNTNEMEQIKHKFLNKYEDIINKYKEDANDIYYYNYVEIFKRLVKDKQYLKSLLYLYRYNLGIRAILSCIKSKLKIKK